MATRVAVSIIYRIKRPQRIYAKIVYLQWNGIQSQQIVMNTK